MAADRKYPFMVCFRTFTNVRLGSFPDIHEWLLSAISGRLDKPFYPQKYQVVGSLGIGFSIYQSHLAHAAHRLGPYRHISRLDLISPNNDPRQYNLTLPLVHRPLVLRGSHRAVAKLEPRAKWRYHAMTQSPDIKALLDVANQMMS